MGSACETIRVEWSARSLQAFADFPLEVLVDQYDLIVVDHPHIPLAADAGLLAPLDAYLTPDVIAELACHSVGQSHASYAHHGHQYALAIDAAAQVSLYRPDLCPNLPRTWDEVLDMARDGTVLWPLKPIDAMSSFLTLSAAHEAPICVSRDQFISREAGLVVLAQMHELAMLVDKACLEENPIETAERLATSDRWRYCPLAFGYVNYSRPGFREHRLAYRDIPALSVASRPFGSCLGGAGIAVSS